MLWPAADEDGVLADYYVYDEKSLGKLRRYLDWTQASIIPCAGITAWSALKAATTGQGVLIQGKSCMRLTIRYQVTPLGIGIGGVAMFASKLARFPGLQVILSSSSDQELEDVCKMFPEPPTLTVDYAECPGWHEEVLKHTDGVGVDFVSENGGPGTSIHSMKSCRRGGTTSQVGYLDREEFKDVQDILPLSIDRRITIR